MKAAEANDSSGSLSRPVDAHEIRHGIKDIVAANFLGRVLLDCAHLIRVSLPDMQPFNHTNAGISNWCFE